MPRKLKVYQTSLGFFDLAVAAPSMKAALDAWGSSHNNLFQQGFAKESEDGAVIAAAMAKPGVVLRRPVGSAKPFKEKAELPTAASLDSAPVSRATPKKMTKLNQHKATDPEKERAAAAAFEKEQRRREQQRQREEAEAAKARQRRKVAIAKAEKALEQARVEHEKRVALIQKDREAVEHRARAEEERWEKLRSHLEEALRSTSE
jgi:hypothetical protein